MFDGDWLLMVVVYNSGEGWVMKVVKVNCLCGKFIDFWLLFLLYEMKIYVLKMLVLSDIFKNSKCYGVKLFMVDESCVLVCVCFDSLVDIFQFVDMVGMLVSKLKMFNVGVKGLMLGVSGLKYVMVLQKYVVQLCELLVFGDIVVVQLMQFVDNMLLISCSYKVCFGDIIFGIVFCFGVMICDLQQWNNLCGFGLKVGQNLVIGVGSSVQCLVNNSDSIIYCVCKGDLLLSIVKCYGVNICDVMCWNSDIDNLCSGDQLMLFVKNSD